MSGIKPLMVVKVSITSNGSLMDKEIAEKILNSKLERINFSVDGLDKQAYEKIRKNLSFEDVLGNVLYFIMLRNKMQSKTAVRISIIKNNYYVKDMNKIVNFWGKILDKNLGDSVKIDDLSLGIVDKSKDKGLSDLEYERSEIFASANQTPCYALWNTMVIKTDGQVALCCVDQCRSVSLGNLETQSIADIWQNSKILKEARKMHLLKGRASMKMCKDCLCWY